MRRKAYVFDLDSTLIQNRSFRYALEKIPSVLGMNEEADLFKEKFFEMYYNLVREGTLHKAFEWDLLTRHTAEKLGATCPEDLFYRLMLEGLEKNLVTVKNGAIELMSWIRESNNIAILLTNGYRKYQIPSLEKTQLIDYFDSILVADDLEKLKPSKSAFEQAVWQAKKLGANDILYIGDHPYFDVYGALNAGLKVIFWITDHHMPKNYKVEDLAKDIIMYTKERYGIKLDLTKFHNRIIHVIGSLKTILNLENLKRGIK